MSRRQKETDIQESRMLESQGDGQQRDLSDDNSTSVETFHGTAVTFPTPTLTRFSLESIHLLSERLSQAEEKSIKSQLKGVAEKLFASLSPLLNISPRQFKNEYDGDKLNRIIEEVAEKVEEIAEGEVMDEAKDAKRGRPEIEQLSSCVEDSKVCSWAKNVYKEIYHKSITIAKNLTQYFVCFICSFFKIFKTESADGRIAHFRRMMLPHVKNMPTARALQKYYAWFAYWKAAAIKTVKELKEEAKYYAWRALEESIHDNLVQLSAQVAK